MIGRLLSAALLLALNCGLATAQERRDGSYYCTEEAAGGLYYNNNIKKWEGATFRPTAKFILRLKFVESRKEKILNTEFSYDEYEVTLKNVGQDFARRCYGKMGGETASLGQYHDLLDCRSASHDYRFNLKSKRFLSVYSEGYVDGEDTNDNTPVIMGGTCTKID